MPKLKDLLPNIFSSNSNARNRKNDVGRLETDACAVGDIEDPSLENVNNNHLSPTVSTELTESVVQELSNPNYNSTTGMVMERNDEIGTDATNTMNVQNNQQQNIVMQFSNANNLHFGSVFNFNNSLTTTKANVDNATCELKSEIKNSDNKRRALKTRTIVTMMQSMEEPNHRMLDTIATHLGEGWKEIMRELGHSDGQIDQAMIDHHVHGGVKEVIYRLLLQWIRGADDNEATLGHITTLLWETNHRDCVERMKAVWKSEEKRKTSR